MIIRNFIKQPGYIVINTDILNCGADVPWHNYIKLKSLVLISELYLKFKTCLPRNLE